MRVGIYSELFEMLSIIVISFFQFRRKNAYHIIFIYENCMISIFRIKFKDFKNHLKLLIDRVN